MRQAKGNKEGKGKGRQGGRLRETRRGKGKEDKEAG